MAELAFILDDVRISDWKDRKTIHDGTSRNVEHISVVTCVSRTGKSFIPERITLQDAVLVVTSERIQG
jgi:hypothetical protein